MFNLYFTPEILTNGYSVDIFTFISLFAVFCAISVIVTKNPIVSVCAPFWLFFVCIYASYLYPKLNIKVEESNRCEAENTINPQY